MDRQMPLAAAFDAVAVSSDRCADASNPVIVYCVSSRPRGSTRNQNFTSLTAPPSNPELLILVVNTQLIAWWVFGTKARMPITRAAPTTCHHTEMLLITAIRRPPQRLDAAARR